MICLVFLDLKLLKFSSLKKFDNKIKWIQTASVDFSSFLQNYFFLVFGKKINHHQTGTCEQNRHQDFG